MFARECINKSADDAEDLICSDTPTVNRADLRNADNETLHTLMINCPAFCCSFQEKGAGLGVTDFSGGALAKTFS